MKVYKLDHENGKEITMYNSYNSKISRIIRHDKPLQMGCIFINSEGCVGLHEAVCDQLFLVISGEGWVTGKEGVKYNIKSGFAAYWESGEIHESSSEHGMLVLVIESNELDLLMKVVKYLDS